uniref:Uncharacterized protein n=1 Tax=Trichuris muris TaxID=70415 RepID=A0A5S6QXQ0_TRIMR
MNYGEAAEPNQSSSVSDGNTLTLTDRFTAESEEERTVAANRHLANNSITLLFQAIASTKGINIPQELLDQMPGDDLFVENGNMAKQKGDLARKFLALKAKGRENKLPFWEFKHAVCHFASIPF